MEHRDYTEDPDVRAMLRFKAGDDAAFRDVYARHFAGVVGFLARGLRSRARAEELAQEVFLRLHRYRERYRPEASFRTYLYRVARNALLNELRSREALPFADDPTATLEALPDHDTPEQRADQEQRVAKVTSALFELPERQRTAVVLTRYRELSYEEAAAAMELSEPALKSLLNRARVALLGRITP